MNQPAQNQEQHNLVQNNSVGRDLIFAPTQIIETQIVEISAIKVTQKELKLDSPYQGLKRFNLKDREYFFGRDGLCHRFGHLWPFAV